MNLYLTRQDVENVLRNMAVKGLITLNTSEPEYSEVLDILAAMNFRNSLSLSMFLLSLVDDGTIFLD